MLTWLRSSEPPSEGIPDEAYGWVLYSEEFTRTN